MVENEAQSWFTLLRIKTTDRLR